MTRRGWTILLLLLPLAVPAGLVGGHVRDEFAIDHDAHRVLRRDMAGKVVWSTKLDGSLGSSREPDLVWDTKRVYVAHGDGVTALDARTGKVAWHAKCPADRMFLSGDLLLAADCTSDGGLGRDGRLLVARATASGKEVFQVHLPPKHSTPCPSRRWPACSSSRPAMTREGGGTPYSLTGRARSATA
jgi:outer membrane protein assembly factor BamB